SLSDTNWFYLEHLVNVIPLSRYSESYILQKNNYIEFKDDAFQYLVKIRDYLFKDGVSPLEFERDNIRNIIINKRKLKLVNDMEKSIYDEAFLKNNFEIFDDKK